MSGTGTPYRNKTLTNKVRNKGPIKKYVSEIKNTVKKLLKKYNGNTSKLEYIAADRNNSLMVREMKNTINQPSFDGTLDKFNGFGITIHGFEGNRIELSSVKKMDLLTVGHYILSFGIILG